MNLEYVYLYDDPDAAGLDVDYLGHWVASLFPDAQVGIRSDFLTFHLARFSDAEREELVSVMCAQLQGAEVTNLVRPDLRDKLPELLPEDRNLDVLYEGKPLQAILRLLVPQEEVVPSRVHITFTANYLGEWRPDEVYLHLRASVLGLPTIISPSSLIESLELPKQYHFMRQQLAILGVEEDVEDMFAQNTIGYGDPRLNEVCKGQVLQAISFALTGESGCDDPECRLYEAATHEAVLHTQVAGKPGLCERHRDLLESFGLAKQE
ncbi:MAG: DUF6775 family putative metallopeptidase [Armatimonadia bacterium]